MGDDDEDGGGLEGRQSLMKMSWVPEMRVGVLLERMLLSQEGSDARRLTRDCVSSG